MAEGSRSRWATAGPTVMSATAREISANATKIQRYANTVSGKGAMSSVNTLEKSGNASVILIYAISPSRTNLKSGRGIILHAVFNQKPNRAPCSS